MLQMVQSGECALVAVTLFDDFWLLMVRKEARKDARKAWAQVPAADHVRVVVAAAAWRRVWLARGDTRYVPLPASWLRGERYDDEIPAEFVSSAHASHVSAVLPDTARGEMPAHVVALLAKLRGGR